jgi:cell wall-associated NlpC family hydrolase
LKLRKQIPLNQKFNSPWIFLFLVFVSLIFLGSCKSKKKLAEEPPAFTVIQTAKSYRGTPYRYGGTTRAGIDCSALVYHSFSSVGITMPRRSEDQSKIGVKIRIGQVKAGDLLFFATGRKKTEVTHSGIVTEVGSNEVRFIHSSTSLGVTEDYLHTPYWSRAFLFAKRILY